MVKKTTTTVTTTTVIEDDNVSPLHVYLLYDRTGSMVNIQDEAVQGLNTYIKGLDPETIITVAAFDYESKMNFDVIRRRIKARHFKPVTVKEVEARGWTSLYDAVGKILNMGLDDKPEKAIFVIQTDGGETGHSKEFNLNTIKSKIELFKNEHHWPVVFLGSEFQEIGNISQSMGGVRGMSVNMTTGNFCATAMNLAQKSSLYGSSAEATCDSYNLMNFTDEEKAEASKPTSKSTV